MEEKNGVTPVDPDMTITPLEQPELLSQKPVEEVSAIVAEPPADTATNTQLRPLTIVKKSPEKGKKQEKKAHKKQLKALKKEWKQARKQFSKVKQAFKKMKEKSGLEAAQAEWGDKLLSAKAARKARKAAYKQARKASQKAA